MLLLHVTVAVDSENTVADTVVVSGSPVVVLTVVRLHSGEATTFLESVAKVGVVKEAVILFSLLTIDTVKLAFEVVYIADGDWENRTGVIIDESALFDNGVIAENGGISTGSRAICNELFGKTLADSTAVATVVDSFNEDVEVEVVQDGTLVDNLELFFNCTSNGFGLYTNDVLKSEETILEFGMADVSFKIFELVINGIAALDKPIGSVIELAFTILKGDVRLPIIDLVTLVFIEVLFSTLVEEKFENLKFTLGELSTVENKGIGVLTLHEEFPNVNAVVPVVFIDFVLRKSVSLVPTFREDVDVEEMLVGFFVDGLVII